MSDGSGHVNGSERPQKSEAAFRTISEVADELMIAQHVLRFWESKFPQIRPMKRAGGRRYYRPEDIDVLKQVRVLLYDKGFTIKGAQKHLRARRTGAVVDDELTPSVVAAGAIPAAADAHRERLRTLLGQLERLRSELAAAAD